MPFDRNNLPDFDDDAGYSGHLRLLEITKAQIRKNSRRRKKKRRSTRKKKTYRRSPAAQARLDLLKAVKTRDLYREISRRGAAALKAKMTPELRREMLAKSKATRAARIEACQHLLPPVQRKRDKGKKKAGQWYCKTCFRTVPAPSKVADVEIVS